MFRTFRNNNKSFLNLQNDMYICFLHIPPKNSTFTQKNGDGFGVLVNGTRKYSSFGDLLVIEDSNACTGRAADFMIEMLIMQLMTLNAQLI